MAIGNWGKEIVFSVSDRKVQTFKDMTRTVGSQWATHSRIGKKDQVEYLRPALQKITFTMELDSWYGVKPRAILDKLASYSESGKLNTLVIGGKKVGKHKWRITDISEEWETIYNRGELARAKVSVTMQEYL
ncbi:MAG: phage tail protein [Oscillospiraceae bacterium]